MVYDEFFPHTVVLHHITHILYYNLAEEYKIEERDISTFKSMMLTIRSKIVV